MFVIFYIFIRLLNCAVALDDSTSEIVESFDLSKIKSEKKRVKKVSMFLNEAKNDCEKLGVLKNHIILLKDVSKTCDFMSLICRYFVFYKKIDETEILLKTKRKKLTGSADINQEYIQLPEEDISLANFIDFISLFDKFVIHVDNLQFYSIEYLKKLCSLKPLRMKITSGNIFYDYSDLFSSHFFTYLSITVDIISIEGFRLLCTARSLRKNFFFTTIIGICDHTLQINPECVEFAVFLKTDTTDGTDPNYIINIPQEMCNSLIFTSNSNRIYLSSESQINLKTLQMYAPDERKLFKVISLCVNLSKLQVILNKVTSSLLFVLQDNIKYTLRELKISIGHEISMNHRRKRLMEKFFPNLTILKIDVIDLALQRRERERNDPQSELEAIHLS